MQNIQIFAEISFTIQFFKIIGYFNVSKQAFLRVSKFYLNREGV